MLILLGSIIIGGLVGVLWGDGAKVLSPFGDIFLNMLLIVVVPLIFLTISSSIYKMKQPKRIGKILVSTFVVFLVTSIVAVLIGMVATYSFRLVSSDDGELIKEGMILEEDNNSIEKLNILDRTVNAITVNDFVKLLSRDNMIALIVVSILVGIAMNMSGDKATSMYKFIESATDVLQNFIKIIMYYAPIGLGCYFAALVGSFGSQIALGYLRTFIIYLIVAVLFYFIVYTIYAYIS